MGSTRSPSSSTLDPHHSPYTHAHQKRQSTSQSSPEDLHDSPDAGAAPRKKRKKNKKERHDDRDHHDHHRNGHDTTLSPQQPIQKLPTIKISLRLPSNPAIIPPSPSIHKSNDSSSKKKRRSSEQISIVSDEDEQAEEEDYRGRQQERGGDRSEEEQDVRSPSTHKKKKKHKHRHRHKHSKHREQESEAQEESKPQETEEVGSDEHREDRQIAESITEEAPTSRITPQPEPEKEVEREGSAPRREGSAPATTKSARKGKAPKRLVTPKMTVSEPPKKKELSVVCYKLLDNFVKRDAYVLFTHPVDVTLVPDYPTVIKNPMDFSTMRAKVDRNFYPNIDEFLKDFQLVCDNARLYNSKETLYWRQADKLWDWGSRAIERERHSILDRDEEVFRTVKDEETVDVGGMGDYSSANSSRPHLLSMESNIDSPMLLADPGRSHTPQQYRKARKIKHRRDGTIAFTYSTDGSIDPASHPDPWSLIPVVQDFGSAPLVCPLVETNPNYSGQYLDDYPYWKAPTSAFRPAVYQDYGPYAILGKPAPDGGSASGVQNIPAYTGMVFGDEKGEAYVRSLAMFLDGIINESELSSLSKADTAGLLEVQEYVREKVETLTRGASTIVDKVAAVIREENTGQLSGVDTRVPMKLWQQDFEEKEAMDLKSKEAEKTKKVTAANDDAQKEEQQLTSDVEMTETPVIPNEEEIKDVKMEEVLDEADEGVKDAEAALQWEGAKDNDIDGAKESEKDNVYVNSKDDTTPATEEEDTADASPPKWIDIKQVVRDIRAWPKIQREKGDYETWKLLKIELDSLLPSSQRSAPSAAAAAPSTGTNDDVKIKWGQSWTGNDSEESKKWVREYLEQNSAEMRQVVQLLATKTSGLKSAAASTATSVAASPSVSVSAAGSPTAASTATDTSVMSDSSAHKSEEQEKGLVERLVKNIRKRLAEMAQYVPLSEVNPQRLPPPPATTSPTPTSTSPTTTSDQSQAAAQVKSSASNAPMASSCISDPVTPSTDSASPVQAMPAKSSSATAETSASTHDSVSGVATPATSATPAAPYTPGTPGTPGDESVSSLSSPGSVSSP
ncbi:hypothetical protein EDD21DRAFT_349781 [Dissophora ornata]|nr:Bromodomain-containing protein 1 [Dissophora ornata]KAI8605711.1 hypothetical protein EDD21DRAFT_349781 [Dissophora ornata]